MQSRRPESRTCSTASAILQGLTLPRSASILPMIRLRAVAVSITDMVLRVMLCLASISLHANTAAVVSIRAR